MTDHHRDQSDSRARVLAEMGVTRPESALFTALYYGFTLPPSDLPARAVQEHYDPRGASLTEEECRAAMIDCLAKGWLQLIDMSVRSTIADELLRDGVLGPIYGGLPEVGCIDFTHSGARLSQQIDERFQRLSERKYPGKQAPFAYTDAVHQKTAWYFQTQTSALAGIEQARGEDDVIAVTGPIPTGAWRAQWWRRFTDGFRIDVEIRRQWQGRSSGDGETCYLQRSPKTDLQLLRRILGAHHITFASWVLLAAMERGPERWQPETIPWWLAEFAEREFGTPVSEAEYVRGLEACLRCGWLRVLDRNVIDEIHALLRNDSALLALPATAEIRPEGCYYRIEQGGDMVPMPKPIGTRSGEIDFSPAGATLYRSISGEWLGPQWEDGLRVSRGYYCEEHHYSVAEEGFQRIIQNHIANGEVVRASRVVPIGPWCVHWWERFPAGYRLELELGDPDLQVAGSRST